MSILAVAKAVANPEMVEEFMKKVKELGQDPNRIMGEIEVRYRRRK